MRSVSLRLALLSGAALVALSAGVDRATAGGFAIREQSAAGQGASYAGVAAGGALSSMFWNPAVMTQFKGVNFEADAAVILGYANNTPVSGTTGGGSGGTGNIALPALVPSGYVSYQLSREFWAGVSLTSPFGLSVSFPDGWAGRAYGHDSSLKTYNISPSLAWEPTNWLSIGVGAQIQWARASLTSGVGAPTIFTTLGGEGWGYGATAGINVKAGPQTDIGLGWRSAINQDINGTLAINNNLGGAIPGTWGSVKTTLNLPDIVSLGIRHRIDPQWTVMGTVEWTNWSRIGTSVVNTPTGQATVAGIGVALPFQYRDGWFGALGAEYAWTPQTTVRAGIAFERSPISDQVRIPLLPDNDRFWVSTGVSYKANRWMTLDFAYSHAFVKDPNVNVSTANGNPWATAGTYIGNSTASFDIFTVAMRFNLSGEPEPKPKLITK